MIQTGSSMQKYLMLLLPLLLFPIIYFLLFHTINKKPKKTDDEEKTEEKRETSKSKIEDSSSSSLNLINISTSVPEIRRFENKLLPDIDNLSPIKPTENASLDSSKLSIRSKKRKLKKKTVSIQSKITKDRMERMTKEHKDSIELAKRLIKEKSQREDEIRRLQKRCKELENIIKRGINEKDISMKEKIEFYQLGYDELESQKLNLMKENTELKREIRRLKFNRNLSDRKGSFSRLFEKEKTEMKKKIKDLETENEKSKIKICELDEEKKTRDSKLNFLKNKNKELEEEKKKFDNEKKEFLEILQAPLKGLNTSINAIEKEASSDDIFKLIKEVKNLDECVSDFKKGFLNDHPDFMSPMVQKRKELETTSLISVDSVSSFEKSQEDSNLLDNEKKILRFSAISNESDSSFLNDTRDNVSESPDIFENKKTLFNKKKITRSDKKMQNKILIKEDTKKKEVIFPKKVLESSKKEGVSSPSTIGNETKKIKTQKNTQLNNKQIIKKKPPTPDRKMRKPKRGSKSIKLSPRKNNSKLSERIKMFEKKELIISPKTPKTPLSPGTSLIRNILANIKEEEDRYTKEYDEEQNKREKMIIEKKRLKIPQKKIQRPSGRKIRKKKVEINNIIDEIEKNRKLDAPEHINVKRENWDYDDVDIPSTVEKKESFKKLYVRKIEEKEEEKDEFQKELSDTIAKFRKRRKERENRKIE